MRLDFFPFISYNFNIKSERGIMNELSQKGKKAVKISLIVIASMLVLCILGIAIYSLVAFAPLRLNIDLAEEKQTISGFGASSQRLGAEHFPL